MLRPKKTDINIKQFASDIRDYLRETTQSSLIRNIRLEDIPIEDLDILYRYLGVRLIVEVFPGGHYKQQVREHDNRMKIKQAEIDSQLINAEDSKFEPHDPSGIGEWQYAERIKQKVFRSLEAILNQNIGNIGHSQYVQAAKALLDQAEKTKTDAAEIMMAYEKQLIVLAEHLVEVFLPELGKKIKQELKGAEVAVLDTITEKIDPESEHAVVWLDAIDKIVRKFELKRYELFLAETMAENQKIAEAFDFTKDLIENYRATDLVPIEEKETQRLKRFISKRQN